MTDIEQALQQELGKLRAAVSYIEDAGQHTSEARKAAADMQAQNEQLRDELDALHQRLAKLEATQLAQAPARADILLAGIGGLLLLGVGSWLLKSR